MIIVGRFLGFVRPLSPFIAGASRMPFRRFFPYDVLAAGAWSIMFCTLGFLFWRSIDKLTTYVSRGLFALGTLVAVIAGDRRADPPAPQPRGAREGPRLDRRARRPARAGGSWRGSPARSGTSSLKPAAAVADFTARFSQDRLTPGNLGLELTTLLALALVGSFSFFLLGDIVLNVGEPRIDRWAADVAERLNMDMLVSLAKVLTHLGSSPGHRGARRGHRDLRGRPPAPDRGRLAGRRAG